MHCCLANAESAPTMSKASISRNASRATSSGYRRCRFSTRNWRASKAVAVAIPGSALLSSRPLMMRLPFCSAESGFPEEIVVLADREFVDRPGVTYAAVASHPDLSGAGRVGGRLANAAAAAKAEARARDVAPIELAINASGPSSTNETTIDLTAEEDDDDECEVLEFALESGRTMRIARAAWSFGTTDLRILTRSNAQLRARSRVATRLSSQIMPSSRKPARCSQ